MKESKSFILYYTDFIDTTTISKISPYGVANFLLQKNSSTRTKKSQNILPHRKKIKFDEKNDDFSSQVCLHDRCPLPSPHFPKKKKKKIIFRQQLIKHFSRAEGFWQFGNTGTTIKIRNKISLLISNIVL